jgi:hypothetical protein
MLCGTASLIASLTLLVWTPSKTDYTKRNRNICSTLKCLANYGPDNKSCSYLNQSSVMERSGSKSRIPCESSHEKFNNRQQAMGLFLQCRHFYSILYRILISGTPFFSLGTKWVRLIFHSIPGTFLSYIPFFVHCSSRRVVHPKKTIPRRRSRRAQLLVRGPISDSNGKSCAVISYQPKKWVRPCPNINALTAHVILTQFSSARERANLFYVLSVPDL